MDEDRLQEKLEELHTELQTVETIDQNELRVLRQLRDDIQRLLERSKTQEANYERLSSNLQDAVKQLEASHPKLAMLLGQVADVLAKMGI